MTVRKEPRRGAVILFASMFIAGNLYSSAGGAAVSAWVGGREGIRPPHQIEITAQAGKSLARAEKNIR
jgi:hypothetical protein